MVEWFRANKKYFLFLCLITVFYGAAFTFSDFYNTPISDYKDFFLVFLQFFIIVVAVFGLLMMLSISKYVFMLLFPLLTLICTVAAYFKYTVGVSLTADVVELALVNDVRTSMDVISWQLIMCVLLSLGVSVFAVVYRFRKIKIHGRWVFLLLSLLIIVPVTNVYRLLRPVSYRLPYSVYYSVEDYLYSRDASRSVRKHFADGAYSESDTLTVVFVLGESLRAKNMQLNGYSRPTNPHLAAEKNVISFPSIYSEYGYTHTSVPYLLTRANHQYPERAQSEPSFISLFKQAGYKTSWIANQESVQTFKYFMDECDTLIHVNGGKSVYNMDTWLDEDILPHFERQLLENGKHKLMVLHTIGSHWYYNAHFPQEFAKWQPLVDSKVISSNSHEQLVNSYDNTVLYSDYFWWQLITRLRDKCAVLIYLSDHSECMGENGEYTHGGTDKEALHYPACFVWYSDKYERAYPEKVEALKENSRKRYNSSFLFHSILSAADIRTPYLQRREDVFSRSTAVR